MLNMNWSRLSRLQIGRYAEYYAKMEFASYSFDYKSRPFIPLQMSLAVILMISSRGTLFPSATHCL